MCNGAPLGWLKGEGPAALEVVMIGFGWLGVVGANKHEVVRGELMGVFEADCPEEAPIRTKDVVTMGAVSDAQLCFVSMCVGGSVRGVAGSAVAGLQGHRLLRCLLLGVS